MATLSNYNRYQGETIRICGFGSDKMVIDKNILVMNLQLFGEGEQETNEDNNETVDITELQKTMLDMKNQIDKLSKENEKLIQHNQELFLRATGEMKQKEEKDSLQEYKEFVGTDFFNSLTNKQQKLLITILEGDDE